MTRNDNKPINGCVDNAGFCLHQCFQWSLFVIIQFCQHRNPLLKILSEIVLLLHTISCCTSYRLVPVNYIEFLPDREASGSQSRPSSATSSAAGHTPSLTNTTTADD